MEGLSPVLKLVPATMRQGKFLADHMRTEDMEEVRASGNYTPKQAVKEALKKSHIAYTFYINNQIVCIFGVVKATSKEEGDFGIPWALTTRIVEKYPRIFWEASKQIVKQMKEDYGMLAVMVDSRYTAAVRWVKHLGFTVEDPKPFGPYNIPFHRITLGRRHV